MKIQLDPESSSLHSTGRQLQSSPREMATSRRNSQKPMKMAG
jgi:hypothetical protein